MKKNEQSTINRLKFSLSFIALGFVFFWPLHTVAAAIKAPPAYLTATVTATLSPTLTPTLTPTPGPTIYTFALIPTATPLPEITRPVSDVESLRYATPKPTQAYIHNSIIPNIATAYCIPSEVTIQEATVIDLFDVNLLLVEIDGEIQSVQLAGTKRIDPETEPDAHFYAQVAARSLINETVLLISHEWMETDTPLLNRYVIANGHFVNYELIRQGLVETDFASAHPCTGFFMVAEKHALRHRIGIWASVPYPERNWPIIAPLFTEEVQFWGDKIEEWSLEWDMDPNLIATIIQIESCGNPNISSVAGAQGLFQVMPIHFSEGEDPVDINTNAFRGLNHLALSYKRYNGDIRKTLAGYNAGWTRADRPEDKWPWETGYYVKYGEGIYIDAVLDQSDSESLDGWMTAGGVTLCQIANRTLGLKP